MKRYHIINHYIQEKGYTSYLEIGVQNKICWEQIICDYKVCVDPDASYNATHIMTSDDFFAQNKEKFDVIFIDGLHESEQVKKDIANSLKALNKGGTIFVHDCNPTTEKMQKVPRETDEWTGDVWKAFAHYRTKKNLNMFVYDTDYGVGVITRGKQEAMKPPKKLTYEWFTENRQSLLQLKHVDFSAPAPPKQIFRVKLREGQIKEFSHLEQAQRYAQVAGGQVL